MDADTTLNLIRGELAAYGELTAPRTGDEWLAKLVRDLDEHLSRGGSRPAAWEYVHPLGDKYLPSLAQVAEYEATREPLGGPVPGANGSHLPESGE